MTLKFLKDTPHTARPNSKKEFKAGQIYVLDGDYAKAFIESGVAVEAKVTLDFATGSSNVKETKNKK